MNVIAGNRLLTPVHGHVLPFRSMVALCVLNLCPIMRHGIIRNKGDDMEQYRFDEYGSVYEYDSERKAYVFIGKLNGMTKGEFIENYEFQIIFNEYE